MSNLFVRARRIYRSGGAKAIRKRSGLFVRRRYFKVLSRLQSLSGEVEVIDPTTDVVAGCIHKLRIRVKNTSRVNWNRSNGGASQRFSVGSLIIDPGGAEIDGPHAFLPADFAPGSSWEGSICVEIPRRAGDLTVKVDLVQENCFWFSELGRSKPAHVLLHIHAHSEGVFAEHPQAVDVTLDITNKCPLKCIQCRKTYFETQDEQQDMDFDLFKRIADDVFPHARMVMLSSAGEPLMTRNFLDAIEITKAARVEEVSFLSSGLHLNKQRAERVVDLGVGRVEFSLDGATPSVYNKIRIGSDFDKVVANIRYLSEYKKRNHTDRPLLRFNYVLMKSNIHDLPAFIDLAAELDVEEVQCQHMVAFIESIRDEALVFDKERSNRFITEAKQRAARQGIRFYHPPLFDLESTPEAAAAPPTPNAVIDSPPPPEGGYYKAEDSVSFERKTHPAMKDGLQICTDPWRKLYIDWQGMVYPCCMWKEEPLGDLKTQTFQEVWNSERYRLLRSQLTTGNLGKSCSECSAITGGDINAERSYFFF